MAIERSGYKIAYSATTKAKVAINSDGNIAQESDTKAGSKYYNFKGVSVDNNLSVNTSIIAAFLDLARGTQDSQSNKVEITLEAI